MTAPGRLRRRAATVLGALGIAVLAGTTLPAPAQAFSAQVTETGWWSKRAGAAAMDRGFEVAAGLGAPDSVAALRVDVSSGTLTTATLVLVESGGLRNDGAALRVCTTAATWASANPGAFAEAPAADCASPIPLVRDAATVSWSADVTPLLAAGAETSLMVVPGEELLPLPFQVTFESARLDAAGEDAATTVSGGGGSGSGATPGAASAPFTSLFSPLTPAPASAGAQPQSLPPATILGSPAAPVAPAVATPAGGVIQRTGASGAGKPWGRLVWMVPASALAGAAAVFGKRFAATRLAPG